MLEHRLGLADAQLALAAIHAPCGENPVGGARALAALCERYGLERGERILTAWLQRHDLEL